MGLFGNKSQKKSEKFLIFLVEDNKIYSRQLEFFIKSKFGDLVELDCSPVAEVAEVKIENGQTPDLIIMDYFLDEKYEEAEKGFDVLKRLKQKYPTIQFILHSSQENSSLALNIIKEGICNYIEKGDEGFEEIEHAINELIK